MGRKKKIKIDVNEKAVLKTEGVLEPVFEFKAKDGGWWSGFPSLEGDILRVHFHNFSSDEDELWTPEQFNCVNDVLAMIRPISEPMQDSDCKDLVRGMVLCVACKRPDSDLFQFYDATLKKLCRYPHKIKDGEENCPCEFEVEWLHGPLQNRIQFVTCGDICLLKPGCIEDDPAIRQFLLKVIAIGTKMKQNGANYPEKAESNTSSFKRLTKTIGDEKRQQDGSFEENIAKRQKVSPNVLDLNDFPRLSDSDTVLSGLPKQDVLDEVSSYEKSTIPKTSISILSDEKKIDIIDLDSEEEKPVISSYDCPRKDKSSSSIEGSSEVGKPFLQATKAIIGLRPIGLKRYRPRVQRDWPESSNVHKIGQNNSSSQSKLCSKDPFLKEASSSSTEDKSEEEPLKPVQKSTEHHRAFKSAGKPSESQTSIQECLQDQTCYSRKNVSQDQTPVATVFSACREQMTCAMTCTSCLKATSSPVCTTVKHVCFNCSSSHHECAGMDMFSVAQARVRKTCHIPCLGCDKCGSRGQQCGNKSAEKINGKTNYVDEHISCSQDNYFRNLDVMKSNIKNELNLKVLKDTQLLLVENLERDITPARALQMISKISHGALIVYIWPSLDFETTRRGYICYDDSESAASAYKQFSAGKFMIISPNGRPWVVSRVELTPADRYQLHVISALVACELLGSEETERENTEGLSIVHRGTDEYATAVARHKLYIEQKNHIRSSYKEFILEEVRLEAEAAL